VGWRKKLRSEMDDAWAKLDQLEEWIDAWDRAADAAMLEPGCPNLPDQPIPAQRQPEKPRDIMGGN
jgi:hypothetical protein